MDSYNSPTTKPLFRGVQVVWYVLSLVEIILTFRFVLRLMGANTAAGFTSFVYGLARPLLAPFTAVFPQTVIEGSVFEWTTLLAMAVYYVLGLVIVQLFVMGKSVSTPEAAAKLDSEERFH